MATEDKQAIIAIIDSIGDIVYDKISHIAKSNLINMVKHPNTIDKGRIQQSKNLLQESIKELEEGAKKPYSAADLDKLQKILEYLVPEPKKSTSKGGKRKSRRRVRKNTLTKRRYRKYI
jgi:hypothetical protein